MCQSNRFNVLNIYRTKLPYFGSEILFYRIFMDGGLQLALYEVCLRGFYIAFHRGVSVIVSKKQIAEEFTDSKTCKAKFVESQNRNTCSRAE